ncbi:unnamed protein product [Urochloa humidicola]
MAEILTARIRGSALWGGQRKEIFVLLEEGDGPMNKWASKQNQPKTSYHTCPSSLPVHLSPPLFWEHLSPPLSPSRTSFPGGGDCGERRRPSPRLRRALRRLRSPSRYQHICKQ